MARIGTMDHWKFRRFVCSLEAMAEPGVARLTDETPRALGMLELLWNAGYAAVSPYVGKPTEIAAIVHWQGDPLVLVTLLVDAGFLDVLGPSEYAIHDLWDHAPRYAQLRRSRKRMSAQSPTLSDLQGRQSAHLPDQTSPVKEQRKSSDAGASRFPQSQKNLEKNDDVLIPLGYELVRQGKRFDSDAELKDALKELAARYNVAYDAGSITRALDALKHAKAPLWFTQGATV